MNNQTICELDEIIRLNPEDAAAYINRGDAYYRKIDSNNLRRPPLPESRP